MNRILLIATLVITFCSCTTTSDYVKNPKRLSQIEKIAVLPIRCNNPAIGDVLTDFLSTNLVATRFSIIERSQLEMLLKEKNLTVEGIMSGRQSFVGKIEGVDAYIFGTATAGRGFVGLANGWVADYIKNCSVRLVDGSTGEVILAVNFETTSPSTFSGVQTPPKVASELAEKIKQF